MTSFHLLIFTLLHISGILGEISQYLLNDPRSHYQINDRSKPTPPLNIDKRVMDLINGEHFDNILKDSTADMRVPSLIVFWNSSNTECASKYYQLDFNNSVYSYLPSRAYLFAATYDFGSTSNRIWYKLTPERDLKQRFKINQCPSIVFVSRNCNGSTKWCTNNQIGDITYLGCNSFIDQCKHTDYQHISTDNWINTVNELLTNQNNIPQLIFNNMFEQERFLQKRDKFTLLSELRNNYVSGVLPAYSMNGYKTIKMHDLLHRDLFNFYINNMEHKQIEMWRSDDTKLNNHMLDSYVVDLSLNISLKEHLANSYIKSIIEEWLGFKVQLSSFYGIREYHSGHVLKNHVDRVDIMVFAVSLSVAHRTINDINTNNINYNTWPVNTYWPFEGVDWNGDNIRFNHEPGTIIMFESAKFMHGRPYPLPSMDDENDLIHLGAFCYFVPEDGSYFRIGHAKNAKANINRFTNDPSGYIKSGKEPLYYPPPDYIGSTASTINRKDKKEL